MYPCAAGKHPPVVLGANAALQLWCCDEALDADPLRALVGTELATLGGTPEVVSGPINYLARRFDVAEPNFFRTTTDCVANAISGVNGLHVVGCFKTASDATQDPITIAVLGAASYYSLSVALVVSGTRYYPRIAWTKVDGTTETVNLDTILLQRGRWYLFCAARYASSGTETVDFYLDGGLVAHITGKALPKSASLPACYWHVGCTVGPGYGNNFDGDISSLAAYAGTPVASYVEAAFADMRMLGYDTQVDVQFKVKDADGTWRDTSDLLGWDFLKSVRISRTVDRAVSTASVELVRDKDDMRLGLLNDNVLNRTPFAGNPWATTYVETEELLHPFRQVQVNTERTPLGVPAEYTGDGTHHWNQEFLGRIVSVECGGSANVTRIECADMLADVQDCFIPVTSVRSTAGGTAVETVMQGMIDDAEGDTPPSSYATDWGLPAGSDYDLVVPESPGWNIREYRQQQESLLAALTTLAEQIGWYIAYAWNPVTALHSVQLRQPARNQTWPNLSLPDSAIISRDEVSKSLMDIRNEVWVTFAPAAGESMTVPTIATGTTTAAVGEVYQGPTGTYAAATTADGQEANRVIYRCRSDDLDASEAGSDSITVNGVRRMIVGEGAASNIDTVAEAQAFGVGMLRDLQQHTVQVGLTVGSLPEAELHDMIRFLAGSEINADLLLAVTTIDLEFGPLADGSPGHTTKLGLRGRPTGGVSRHLELEVSAKGVPPPTVDNTVAEVQAGMTTHQRRQLHAALISQAPQYLAQSGASRSAVRNADFTVRTFGDAPPDTWEIKNG